MRLAGPDIVLFVVGLLLFSGASYAIYEQGGLAALQEPTSALGQFAVVFDTSTVELETRDVASMRSVDETFDVNASRVSQVTVVVTCTDAQAANVAPFQLQVQVSGPAGLTGEGSGTCGTDIPIEIDVADVPAETLIGAETQTEAEEAYHELETEQADANLTRAQGSWTVSVTGGRSAGPLPVPDQVPPPSGSIAFTFQQWEPRFNAVQGR